MVRGMGFQSPFTGTMQPSLFWIVVAMALLDLVVNAGLDLPEENCGGGYVERATWNEVPA